MSQNRNIDNYLINLFLVIIFFLCYIFMHVFPDWESYKEIYISDGSYLTEATLDIFFVSLIRVFNFLKFDYFIFRIIILVIIIFFYSKILKQLNRKEQCLFFLLNFVFIYIQIRQGLALSFFYYFYTKNKFYILKYFALFTHFLSILPFFFMTLSQKIQYFVLVIVLIVILNSNVLNSIYLLFTQNYDGRLAENILNNDSSLLKSIITPLLFLFLFFRIKIKTTSHYVYLITILFILFYQLFFKVYFYLPNVLINGVFRYFLVYLSLCILSKNIQINWFNIFVALVILFKDVYSSQLSLEY